MTTSCVESAGQVILQQMGGARRIKMMTGARQFLLLSNGVRVQFPNPDRRRANMVEVVLDSDDTYTMRFYRSAKLLHEVSGVYNDHLIEIFERQTGLYLRL